MSLVQAMQWRYAPKKFDPSAKLNTDQIADLLETARLAPTSFNLQPFRFILVNDPDLRERIKTEATPGQPQITDSSHLVILATETDVNEFTVQRSIDLASDQRQLPRDTLANREQFIISRMAPLTPDARLAWAEKQTYLALGVLITAAAAAGIDAGPMEGFDPRVVDSLLGLNEQRLTATVLVALGRRAEEDAGATLAKVRKPWADLITEI